MATYEQVSPLVDAGESAEDDSDTSRPPTPSGSRRRWAIYIGIGLLLGALISLACVYVATSSRAAPTPKRSFVARSYNETRAVDFARLAGAAYCPARSVEAWSCGYKCVPGVSDVRICRGRTTLSFVARWEGLGLVSFKGTSDIPSFMQDLAAVQAPPGRSICSDCKVHAGFVDEWRSMKGCVVAALGSVGSPEGSEIRMTGHSLGAALAGIGMLDLATDGWVVAEAYNFGMPRAGDAVWAGAFNGLFADGRFYRVTHRRDPIPHLPPKNAMIDWDVQHVDSEVFYGDRLEDGHRRCPKAGDLRCADQFTNLPLMLVLSLPDHLLYMGVHTSIFGCSAGLSR